MRLLGKQIGSIARLTNLLCHNLKAIFSIVLTTIGSILGTGMQSFGQGLKSSFEILLNITINSNPEAG